MSDYYECRRWRNGALHEEFRPDGEDDVLDIAREWSVDPMTLSQRADLPDVGLLARYPRK